MPEAREECAGWEGRGCPTGGRKEGQRVGLNTEWSHSCAVWIVISKAFEFMDFVSIV